MKRPHAITIRDACTFGLVSALATAAATYVQTTHQSLQAYALSWVTAAAFWFIYVSVMVMRARLLAQYPMTVRDNIIVDPEQYKTSVAVLDNEVTRTVGLYAGAGIPDGDKKLAQDTVWLKFRPGPFPHPQILNMKVAGFVTVGGEGADVGYTSVDEPVEKTALAHELGHVILGRTWNDWDEARHHAFMKAHGLP